VCAEWKLRPFDLLRVCLFIEEISTKFAQAHFAPAEPALRQAEPANFSPPPGPVRNSHAQNRAFFCPRRHPINGFGFPASAEYFHKT
jgi:hypothetical protein